MWVTSFNKVSSVGDGCCRATHAAAVPLRDSYLPCPRVSTLSGLRLKSIWISLDFVSAAQSVAFAVKNDRCFAEFVLSLSSRGTQRDHLRHRQASLAVNLCVGCFQREVLRLSRSPIFVLVSGVAAHSAGHQRMCASGIREDRVLGQGHIRSL